MNDTNNLNLSYEAIGQILKSSEMLNVCASYANKYAESGDDVRLFIGFDRAHAIIYPKPERN